LGASNSGKSLLFNRLLSSDYCVAVASDALKRATVSLWLGTTIGMLKFPITFLNAEMAQMREVRLDNDRKLLKQIEMEREKIYKKTQDLSDATLIGIVGSSFESHTLTNPNEINALIEDTHSFDNETVIFNDMKTIHSIQKVSI
jgi:hypothetical protein